jgi:pyridoxamine 5'-phosphate oxidase
MSDYDVTAGGPEPVRSLRSMRVRYTPGPLLERDVDPSPLVQVGRWLADAVTADLPEPNAMVLSTTDAAGRVSSRHVLLKEMDTTGFVFYTNLRSRKAAQIDENPRAALCFPWFEMSRQVCVEGSVHLLDRPTVTDYWRVRPRESQLGAWASAQSTTIESRDALHARLAEVEHQFPLGTDVPVPEFWGGFRLLPTRVELWQGQPGRLHDRLVYERVDDGWGVTRLQP